MRTVYKIHRRIHAPIEFQGLKGQYILYAIGAVVMCLVLFALLYIAGVNSYICLLLCFGAGIAAIGRCLYLSHRFGVYGWRKRRMVKRLPKALRAGSRKIYLHLKK